MTRESLVLAAMAAGGEGAVYSPAQIQKLFFILDREAAHVLGGPHFNFAPYNYGPFDSAVYDSLDRLALRQLVGITNRGGRHRQYTLTPEGNVEALTQSSTLRPDVKEYLSQIAKWILSMDFKTLVSAVYAKYPDMKVNSVFVS